MFTPVYVVPADTGTARTRPRGRPQRRGPGSQHFKGYVALWMIAYATQDIGKFDQKALVADLHSHAFCVSKYPHLLESTHWDQHGDIDRTTFVVKISNQQQQVVDSIPALQPTNQAGC